MNIKLILVRMCSLRVLITGIGRMNMMISEEIFRPGVRSVSCGRCNCRGRRAKSHDLRGLELICEARGTSKVLQKPARVG
jgi:hypothetical protein